MAASSLLIVDDEQQLRSIMVENLEPLGVTIASAKDGTEALDMIAKTRFDAVLCDVRMPGMDGLQLLQKLREDGHDVPFVFLTGFAEPDQMRRALQLGAIDYLEKPWSTPDLMRAILRALEFGRCTKRLENKIADAIPPDKTAVIDELRDYWRKLMGLRARQ